MNSSLQADRRITHAHFHQENTYNYKKESKLKCQIICTFILPKLFAGTETLSLCNSSYYLVHNILRANQTLILSAKIVSSPRSLHSDAFQC